MRSRIKMLSVAAIAVCSAVFVTLPVSTMPDNTVAALTVSPRLSSAHVYKRSYESPAAVVVSGAGASLEEAPSPSPVPPMLAKMAELCRENEDIAGWLRVEGTAIDYPVMYTPDDKGFYLYRAFDRQNDPTRRGLLFIDENCTVEPRSVNLIIYGHNMKDGSMFQALTNYLSEDFYRRHSVIEYSTLYEVEEYEIVAVFLSKIYNKNDDVFKYYQFFDAQTEAEFDYFIDNVKALALYDTGVEPQFGDRLITLSTCEYSQENGRLAVVGCKRGKG